MLISSRPGRESAAAIVITTYASIAIAGTAGILVARTLGPEGRGELAAIQTWPILLGTLAALGLPEALVYFAAKEPHRAGAYVGTATGIMIASTVIAAGAGYLMLPLLLRQQPPDTIEVARAYLVVTLLSAGGVSFHALRGLQRFEVWNLLRLLPAIAWFLIALVAWLQGSTSASGLAYASIISAALLVIPFTIAVVRNVSSSVLPDKALVRPLFRFGLPNLLALLPQTLNLRLDQMLLIMLFPARSVGFYVVAVSWASLSTPVVTSIGTIMFPRIAAHASMEERATSLQLATRLAVLLTLLVTPMMALVTPVVLPLLFGQKFNPAVEAALVLVAAAGLSALNVVLQDNLRGCGRPSASLWAEAVGLCFTLPLLLLFLKPFGLMGAALASLVSYAIVFAVLIWLTCATLHLRLRQLIVPTPEDVLALREAAKALLRASTSRPRRTH